MIYLELFLTFLKIGAFTFGGGYAMLPLIQQEVINNNWLTASELMEFVAISESTPGPFAINISTYVGYHMGGLLGALCATLGVVMPSFVIILIVVKILDKFKSNKLIKGAMFGLKGSVCGLIAVAVITAVKSAVSSMTMNVTEIIVACLLLLVSILGLKKKVHPIYLIVFSAVVGIIFKTVF